MDILCHRGLWTDRAEQNTLSAYRAAWDNCWGVELDVRDLDGEIVVSHDMPRTPGLTFADVLECYVEHGSQSTIAVNVKADGLVGVVAHMLAEAGARAFVFDMSVPDHLAWLRASVPTYTRWSDVEPNPVLLEESAGVWLDAFHDDSWWTGAAVHSLVTRGIQVAVVSPELHRRDPSPTWRRIVDEGLHDLPGFALCTDRPHDWLKVAV